MRILAFDTATPATTVALCAEGREEEARDDPPRGARPGHTTHLMPLAVSLLDGAGIAWEALDRIAVGTGPGTFTGLRIGVATARALARARGIPLTGVSTLRSLALNAREPGAPAGPETVLAVLDARRREVFAAAWRRNEIEAGTPLFAARAVAPEALVELINELQIAPLALGDGAVEFRSVLGRSEALIPEDGSTLHRVTAIQHCRLARALPGSAPDEVHPEYLRLPDAEISRRTATQS